MSHPKDQSAGRARFRPAVAAIIVPALLVVLAWPLLGLPGRYVFALGAASLFGVYPLVLLLALRGRWVVLPRGPVAMTFALMGYALPFQLVLCWVLVGWPPNHALVVHLGELWIATLVCWGIRWLVTKGPSARRLQTAYVAISAALGLTVILAASPAGVVIDGLAAMAHIPTVRPTPFGDLLPVREEVEIVQLSDLHLTGAPDRKTTDGRAPGDQLIADYLDRVTALRPRFVVVTGDLTDSGEQLQWEKAAGYLGRLAGSATVIAAPGNHDLTPAYARMKEVELDQQLLQQGAYLAVLNQLNPGIQTGAGPLGELIERVTPSPKEVELRAEEMKSTYIEAVVTGGDHPSGGRVIGARRIAEEKYTSQYVRALLRARALAPLWPGLFPLHWRSPDGSHRFLVLNSSANADPRLGQSAIGSYGDRQVAACARLLTTAGDDPATRFVGVLTHHPLARPPEAWNELLTILDFGELHLQTGDSIALLQVLLTAQTSHPEIQWYVFYGHRHHQSLGEHCGLSMMEAPALAPAFSPPEKRGMWTLVRDKERLQPRWAPLAR
jgi:hypothetical protein